MVRRRGARAWLRHQVAESGFLPWINTGSIRRDAANAQLMATAPQFLDYCKLLLDDVIDMIEHGDDGHDWNWCLTRDNLEAFIATAEGDSSVARQPTVAATRA